MVKIDKNNPTELIDSIIQGKKGKVAKIVRTLLLERYKVAKDKRK